MDIRESTDWWILEGMIKQIYLLRLSLLNMIQTELQEFVCFTMQMEKKDMCLLEKMLLLALLQYVDRMLLLFLEAESS